MKFVMHGEGMSSATVQGQGYQVDALLTSQLNQQLAKHVARGSHLPLSLSLPSSDVVIDLSGDNLANKQAKPSL